jgi:hypothetical protein
MPENLSARSKFVRTETGIENRSKSKNISRRILKLGLLFRNNSNPPSASCAGVAWGIASILF